MRTAVTLIVALCIGFRLGSFAVVLATATERLGWRAAVRYLWTEPTPRRLVVSNVLGIIAGAALLATILVLL